jgi:hypothetical protein
VRKKEAGKFCDFLCVLCVTFAHFAVKGFDVGCVKNKILNRKVRKEIPQRTQSYQL